MNNETYYNATAEDGTSIGNFLNHGEVDEFVDRCRAAISKKPEIANIKDRRVQLSALLSSRPFYRHGIGSEPSFALGNIFLDSLQSADQIH